MRESILNALKKVEEDFGVKILYACESGSRSWKFPSKDSDYDVRFIYVHKKEDYLTIDPMGVGTKRDVIELPITNILDMSGWELTKALRLLRKSNPSLMEWLNSGTVYYQAFSTIESMQELSKTLFAPSSCLHHYLNMANSNFRNYLLGEEMKIKDYFKVLRPVLAAGWIEKFNEFPPLEFPALLNRLIPEGPLKNEINSLLKSKLDGEQIYTENKARLNHFLNEEILRLRGYNKTFATDLPDITPKLDSLFRTTLKEVWN